MRIKKAAIFILLLILISTVVYATTTTIIIDGEKVLFNESLGFPFIDENGRTQVPFRATLEKFGAQVSWDSINNMALAEKNGIIVGVPIGQNQIFRNGVMIPIDTGALIKDGRTYLPIRAVMEAFGCEVGWDSVARAVSITSSPEQSSIPETIQPSEVSVHFIDVGQADCIFIDAGDYDILIDGGNNADGMLVVEYLASLGTDDIELMIATHNHEDHIGGLDDVLAYFEVEHVIDSGQSYTTATYNSYWQAVQNEGCQYSQDANMIFNIRPSTSNCYLSGKVKLKLSNINTLRAVRIS